MPKINWDGEDEDDVLTADDIENAEDGYQAYAGDIPPAGVYRFKVRRIKYFEASTGTKGLKVLLLLDGSWKGAHRKFDGCPLWDNVWMTKGSAAFVKAFATAIGVSAADIISKVVADEDDVVTKIGRKAIKEDEIVVYVAVRQDEYNDNVRLDKAGTGYQIVDAATDADDDDDSDEEEAEAPRARKATKAARAPRNAEQVRAASKTKGKGKNDDDDPPF